jgi:phosphoglycerate dehydrogenase-like enzyme
MKENTVLVNIARGSIIDEKAMIENLKSGRLKGAALDVFNEEPLPLDNLLWNMENVIITPHNSWMSEQRNERRFSIIYENLKRYGEGRELLNIVDIDKGY